VDKGKNKSKKSITNQEPKKPKTKKPICVRRSAYNWLAGCEDSETKQKTNKTV